MPATDIAQLARTRTDPWAIKRVTDNVAAEFTPKIIAVDDDTLMALWTRVEGDVSWVESPEDVAPHLEIVSAWYDRALDIWSEPLTLTSNEQVDRDPLSVVYGDKVGAMWIQNQGKAMIGEQSQGDSLMFRAWTASSWSVPVTLWSGQKGILGFSFVEDADGQGHVVLAADEDGDLETVTDRELYRISTLGGVWQAPVKLTDDDVEDSLPLLLAVEGSPMLIWKTDGMLKYTTLDEWTPTEVYQEYTVANEAPTLAGVTLPGGAAIAYTVQGPNGVDIVAAFYDASLDRWSLPRPMTRDEAVESSLSMGFDGEELVIAYLKTETLRENMAIELDGSLHVLEEVPRPGRTDLYVLRYSLGHDLAVAPDSLIFEPVNPAPGATAEISAIIENKGELAAEDVLVSFFEGNPDEGGILVGQASIPNLLAGESRKVSVLWEVSNDANSKGIYVIVDPEMRFDDKDRRNNMTSAWTVFPDLVIQTDRHDWVSNYIVALTATIGNDGTIPTGLVDICWRLGSENGEELGCIEMESIEPNAVREATLTWDSSGHRVPAGSVVVYTIADPTASLRETDVLNNISLQSLSWPERKRNIADVLRIMQFVTGMEAWVDLYYFDVNEDGRVGRYAKRINPAHRKAGVSSACRRARSIWNT
jgi:hypothetical protein